MNEELAGSNGGQGVDIFRKGGGGALKLDVDGPTGF